MECENLGLTDAERASLTGFTYRAALALAHLREAWLNADEGNASAIEGALAVLFIESHSFQRNVDVFFRVLEHDHERGQELFDGVNQRLADFDQSEKPFQLKRSGRGKR